MEMASFWRTFIFCLTVISGVRATCPWNRNPAFGSIEPFCQCESSEDSGLSVSCHDVDFVLLMRGLREYAQDRVIEFLVVQNSTVPSLEDFIFKNLKIISLRFGSCGIKQVGDNAFRGLENTLQNLNLGGNSLRFVPVDALRNLRLVSFLDLSSNNIKYVTNNAFVTLRLKTLKLSENNLTLSESALRGLETSLENLHLKDCQLKGLPPAILGLGGLNFLDLASNNIRSIPPEHFKNMNSLSALNLERNVIQKLDASAFLGVNDTLKSLSLLNNLITEYPFEAIRSLKQLKILDLGFNLMRNLPPRSFEGLNYLTLLAVDGNPMSTLPEIVFRDVRATLKGLSLGGRFLVCDCRISWISIWILEQNLQVTSREKNPQFCGSPQNLRHQNFYQLKPTDLTCGPPPTTAKITTLTTTTISTTSSTTIIVTTPTTIATSSARYLPNFEDRDNRRSLFSPPKENRGFATSVDPSSLERNPGDIVTKIKMTVGGGENSEIGRSRPKPVLPLDRPLSPGVGRIISQPRANLIPSSNSRPIQSGKRNNLISSINTRPVKSDQFLSSSSSSNAQELVNGRPLSSLRQFPPPSKVPEIIIQDAYKEANSIVIKWASKSSNILGFRIVYRLFGVPEFKQGPPLSPDEREFRIKNVPSNECIAVCVISLEDVDVTPGDVPFEQCQEMRTERVGAQRKLDYIIIPASAAIVATVIIAVIIFIACLKTGQKKRESKIRIDQKPLHGLGSISNPGPPLAELAALGFAPTTPKEWDQLSMYSQRSASRSRMYHDRSGSINGGYIPDDARSHISQMSNSRAKSRSINDLTGKQAPLGLSRTDIRQSRQSLMSAVDGRLSRNSGTSRSSRKSLSRRSRAGSVYRNTHHRSAEDSMNEDSDNWATSTDNNWTDYDQDVYVHSNPTANFGPNIHMMRRDDVNL